MPDPLAGDLAAMQAEAAEFLPDSAVIHTKISTSDGQGGHTENWNPAGTVPGRITPASSIERSLAGRLSAETEAVVTLAAAQEISPGARISFGERFYEVIGTIEGRSWEITSRVEVKNIAAGGEQVQD